MKTILSLSGLLILFLSGVSSSFDSKVQEAKAFVKSEKLDSTVCVLIDMSIHSGKKRLFVYDLAKDSILKSGLVAHGCGKNPWGEDQSKTSPTFSNVNGSHLSSLGKFKIGKRGYSNWGINVNYKLHGLEGTNSNAYKRIIVLHGWADVANIETYPKGTPEGWGCPAVSNEMMTYLDKTLKNKGGNVLMWIYK